MNKIEETIQQLQEKDDSQFIFVANPIQEEDEIYVDGRKVEKLMSHLRTGVYVMLPQIIFRTSLMDDEMMDFYSSCWLAKDSIGYEAEDIHLIVDRTIPEDHGLEPEVLKSLTINFDNFVEQLREMDHEKRAEKWFGGEMIEL